LVLNFAFRTQIIPEIYYIDKATTMDYFKSMFSYLLRVLIILLVLFAIVTAPKIIYASSSSLKSFTAHPPIHIYKKSLTTPYGFTPSEIKAIYHLPATGGKGTIAIIGAYLSSSLESDLQVFSRQFKLPDCTQTNQCLEIHPMATKINNNSGWAEESALDTQWTHAIAPQAKVLFIAAKSDNGNDLLAAVDYAKNRKDVVAVSMSWGGSEFAGEEKLESHFMSSHDITFFASSGDNGTGVNWPAVSPHVIGVGGTTFHMTNSGNLTSETAWTGSGGGVSKYFVEPQFQIDFGLVKFNNKRAVPDVSYNADPNSGFAVYHQGWLVVGGTSAGAPQWAAIRALGKNFTNTTLYQTALNSDNSFRDILTGNNGDCGTNCKAHKNYDLVTGLGSPLTFHF
jgi:subtilase family serine protease